ncbi:hypothetical protein ABW19_dt0209666 [Dactylella cylindrospora]|nr:hypothetical protein ABW19_dt0209666 [Dactylella cylindrospora]
MPAPASHRPPPRNTTNNANPRALTFTNPRRAPQYKKPPPPKSVLPQPKDEPTTFFGRWRQVIISVVVFLLISGGTIGLILGFYHVKAKSNREIQAGYDEATGPVSAPGLLESPYPYTTAYLSALPAGVTYFLPKIFPGVDINLKATPNLLKNPSFNNSQSKPWLNRDGYWNTSMRDVYPAHPRASIFGERHDESDLVQTAIQAGKGSFELTFLYSGTCDEEKLCQLPSNVTEPAWFWVRAGGGFNPSVVMSTNVITSNNTGLTQGYEGFRKAGFKIVSNSRNFTVAFSGYNYCGSWSVAQIALIKIPQFTLTEP